ncbi:adenosylcobinamide-GDP ribazoletransferase [Agrobacterium fabrum]|uniref:Adenosylcobinamide-GDP ribazoletransferase n=1 Tax=Agrobacterium fabrum TaxID=1176649 RepID=A0A7Z7BH10_9HYPH|nr:adenosylcobinamide-GDP ribazoletransferase [Agrobacterium fabrum]CAH0286597.1 Adenosylcobinamide-GDP ribazoletransferase [Agrobacterium fabrum]CAH0294664.1 Adenosylcobinamide-GDP ribazoletransferase [Agrobacterium fabrum]CUX12331.1 Cobalamin synthase [Agrobacterium fabrum str. J-07]SDJ21926.1 cobalamin-5'-phosphate synthase [Agrobacterium fabrum]
MKAGDFITDVMHSVAFLSRLPVPSRFFDNADGMSMRRTARAFPAAGLLIALPAAFLVVIFANFDASPQLTGWLAVGLTALITGALHEDGLADMADGFGSGKDKARMLEIMKDSRIGSYGTIAMVLSFALRATALTSLVETVPGKTAAACLIAALVMSRALMVWHWQALPAAKTSGIAAGAGQPGESERNIALVTGLLVFILFTLHALPVLSIALVLAVAILATVLFGRLCERKIGGHTGDTIGACQQITEIVTLVALALAA